MNKVMHELSRTLFSVMFYGPPAHYIYSVSPLGLYPVPYIFTELGKSDRQAHACAGRVFTAPTPIECFRVVSVTKAVFTLGARARCSSTVLAGH